MGCAYYELVVFNNTNLCGMDNKQHIKWQLGKYNINEADT